MATCILEPAKLNAQGDDKKTETAKQASPQPDEAIILAVLWPGIEDSLQTSLAMRC